MTREIKKGSKLHTRITTRLSSMIKMAEAEQAKKHDKWKRAEEAVLAYLPETAADAVRAKKRDDGLPSYTTIVVPYTFGIVMTVHTYLTSVFFGRVPIHQFVGSSGEGEQQTQALEALISSQVQGGDMLGPYYIWLYDAVKYGVGIIGEFWDDETIQFSRVEEIVDPFTLQPVKTQTTRQVPGYQGNRIVNVSPFEFLPDPRVPVQNFQKGEFCGIRKEIGWNTLVRRARQGYYMNVEEIESTARWSGTNKAENESALERPNQYVLEDVNDEGKKTKRTCPAVIAPTVSRNTENALAMITP